MTEVKENLNMGIKTKLVGVIYGDAPENINLYGWKDVGSFAMVREPDNPHDPNAIRVELGGKYLGHLPKDLAETLAPKMDAGRKFIAMFVSRNESPVHDTVGLTVEIVETAQIE